MITSHHQEYSEVSPSGIQPKGGHILAVEKKRKKGGGGGGVCLFGVCMVRWRNTVPPILLCRKFQLTLPMILHQKGGQNHGT